MKKLTSFITVILLLGVSLLLISCGKANESSGDKNEGEITLEYWVGWSPGEENAIESKKLIEQYEKENPNININIQELNYDMIHDKLVTGITAGDVPDLSWGLGEWVADLNGMGGLMDLTGYVNEWNDKENIQQSSLDALTINDKLVGLPYQTGARALLVHENMLKDTGINKVPETWDELIRIGKEYNENTGKYLYGMTGTSVRAPQEMIGYFAQQGVEIASESENGKFRNTWNDNPKELEAATKVFAFYQDLIENKVVDPNAKTWDWETADTNFATGTYAMEVVGNWMQERESSNPETMKDVSVTVPPYGEEPATFLEVKPIFIFKQSEHPEEAWKFAQFLLSKEFQEKVQSANTPRTDVVEDTKWGNGFKDLGEIGVSFPPVPMGNITKNMEDALAKVIQNNEKPKEVAKWLSDEINKSLKTSGVLSED
ncbi:ABC transporter substrate-binding protein [Gracilibacillus salinarum]|uniref:Sugar ABC transporter substrate-binding protein n=1 Tax=Gracilibacillus salinarum TaxID=2932255 RepID=A0ABY4GUW4_9BACI|nr:sugar ABC transporter substrate-binding protein [Gracilibacillus salinarum]UOQ86977.1 sugar ABC transporter substrate-binding protein [Gracilibacillus salinarum]